MGDLSPNFSRYEFRCSHCGRVGIDIGLIPLLEEIREWAGDLVHITSGFRCTEHNRIVGGGEFSFHLTGRAADIKVAGRGPGEVFRYLNKRYPNSLGLGIYSWGVHVDNDSKRRRWDGRKKVG